MTNARREKLKRVAGIDPGYGRAGVAIVGRERGKEKLVFSKCLTTSQSLSHEKRLERIGDEVGKLLRRYRPEAVAVEKLFFAANQKTALQVAEARGVILSEAAKQNLPVHEFTPLEIKLAVTGDGRADKRQVIAMVERLIAIKREKPQDDEYDAIAAALTLLATIRSH
ncbi:crossover junction endodeoxyribonuclease RuvC [Patescibacteria group bacterium]|nr:MAG: crossover junction endodeoxyribonuclease RuvC [Patescibacteria group bacterium]